MDSDSLVVKDLVKTYGDRTVLGPVSFSIQRGQIVSLAGTNGAGKTTLLEILSGERIPTSGKVSVFGRSPGPGSTAFLPQTLELFDNLTVEENIRHFSTLSGSGDPEELMDIFSISDRADSRYGSLSGGLKQRVNVACIMCGDPEVILMDEPSTGMDPAVRADVWDIIRKLKAQGVTVLLSTHFLGEAKINSDRIMVLDKGKIIYDGDPIGCGRNKITVTVKRTDLSDISGRFQFSVRGNNTVFTLDSPGSLNNLLNQLSAAGIDPDETAITAEDDLGGIE